ncbi:MAG: hypothetical protein K0U76_03250 [Actinomycetia bacterium]|nr:hypothetical protein [Actinomycetes bacterium]MCH9700395.1 hypothetical protein [Actinomycetes bacterium]MCH9759689.1 hypothetical protein [Actinomycetes bacterium]
MNDIDRWFERTARRENRVVSLYTSLLTGRLFAYFRYRLRYSLLLDTARFLVHAIEFLILLTALGGLAAFTVIVLRVGSLIINGGWWGLLEVMRERLRVFSGSGDRDAAEHEIGRWLILSAVAASVLTIVILAVLDLLLPPDHGVVGHVYAVLVVLELAIRLPVRVLHSGMYATRRIYRPLWSMFAPTLVQIVVLGVGYYLFPAAALIIGIIASNALGTWITVHYTLKVYRLVGLWPKYGARTREPWWRLPRIPLSLGVKTTVAGLSLRLDGVIVLAILGIYGTNTRALDLTEGVTAWRGIDAFQFFYLVLPLFRGAYEGTALFYFDFVRLRRAPALRELRLLFFRRLLWTTPVIAVYFWLLAAALGLFVLKEIPISFLLALLPLFVVRSVTGIYQIRLFAEGRFGTLIASVVLLAALLWLVWLDAHPASDLLEVTAAMITLLIVLINLQHFQDRQRPLPTLLAMGDWMGTLARETGPVLVGKIVIPKWIPPRQRSAVVTLMQQSLHGTGYFSFRSSTTLVYYIRTSNDEAQPPPHLRFQELTGGAANHGKVLAAPTRNGSEALERLATEKWIQPLGDVSSRPEDPGILRSKFRTLFPEGVVFDLETLEGTRDMRSLKRSLLAGALPTAMKGLEDGAIVVPLSGRWLTPIFHRGRLRLLLLLPPDPEDALLESWLRIVQAWHIRWGATQTARSTSDG